MKVLKLSIIISLLICASSAHLRAQDYATVSYWGKDYKLERHFFEYLNANYTSFMNNTAPNWRYYDFKDCQELYVAMVENLKNSNFKIIVTEANQLQWQPVVGLNMPGADNEKGRSNKSKARATWILYQVILPSLQQFVRGKS